MPKRILLFIVLVLFMAIYGFVNADSLLLGPECFGRQYSNTTVNISMAEITPFNGHDLYTLYAQIFLPEGAKITSMVVFYYDNNNYAEIRVGLYRRNLYDKLGQTIIPEWSSTDSATDPMITKRTNVNWAYNKILNRACTYHVKLTFYTISMPIDFTNMQFYGLKIFYMPPTS